MTGKMIDGSIETYVTDGGITVSRSRHKITYEGAMEPYIDGLDTRRGAVFSSNYEYPGRYTRWDTATIDPPLTLTSKGRDVMIEGIGPRGVALIGMIAPALGAMTEAKITGQTPHVLKLRVNEPDRKSVV